MVLAKASFVSFEWDVSVVSLLRWSDGKDENPTKRQCGTWCAFEEHQVLQIYIVNIEISFHS